MHAHARTFLERPALAVELRLDHREHAIERYGRGNRGERTELFQGLADELKLGFLDLAGGADPVAAQSEEPRSTTGQATVFPP
jgi:hypothetical protein